jgi:hypothetical protein
MAWKGFGLKKKSNLEPILGYSDRSTVKLDFDSEQFRRMKHWADRAMKHFRLGGCLILRSSRDNYHVIFNSTVTWEKNCRVMAWVSLLSKNVGLKKWTLMQMIKGASTLRISFKQRKPSPRIVFRLGKQDKQIDNFIRNRHLIKKIIKKL